jgi:YVTN family beta-propeller protein
VLASSGVAFGFAQVFNPVQVIIPDLGNETNGIAVNNTTRMTYVAVDTGVWVVDETDRPVGFIPLPEPTYYMGVEESQNLVFAGGRFSATLYVIDGQDRTVRRTISLGDNFFVPQFAVYRTPEDSIRILAPTRLCIGTPACITLDFLAVFDVERGEIADTFFIGDQGVATAFDPVNRIVYAGVFAGPLDTVKVIDLVQRKVVDSIEVGSSLAYLAFNPVTRTLYASDYDESAVYVIDATTNQVRDRIFVGAVPEGIGIDTVTNRLYVTSTADRFLYVIDGETNGVLQFLDTQGFTSQVGVLQGARQVYVNVYGGRDVRVLKF